MPPVDLVSDIWDLIIDIVSDGLNPKPDHSSLRNLALTCKAMVSPCREHLFSTVVIEERSGVDMSGLIGRFHNLVIHNPSIIQYIRHVQYQIRFAQDVRVHQIFQMLGKSTTLRSIELWDWNGRWNKYPEPLQTALERLIRLPSITALHLSQIGSVPSSIFFGSNNITHLTLKYVEFAPTHDPGMNIARDSVSAHRPIYLDVSSSPFSGHMSLKDGKIVDFSGLREIKFFINHADDMEGMKQVLRMSREVQSLDISTLDDYEVMSLAGLGTSLSTWNVGTLKKLTLRRINIASEYDEPLCDLVPELAMIAGINIVEEIYLEVQVTFEGDKRARADMHNWSALDSLLTRPGSFPRLTVVTISIRWNTSEWSDEDEASIRDHITERDFPQLLDSKGLEFRFLCEVRTFRCSPGCC